MIINLTDLEQYLGAYANRASIFIHMIHLFLAIQS